MEGRIVGEIDSRGKARVQTLNDEPSRTVQSDSHLADIHNILESYGQKGHDYLDDAAMEFLDVSEFGDYQDVMNNARDAEVEFMRLPSKVREIFDHDVAVWLDTAHDEDKRDEMVAQGFLEPREPVADPVDPPKAPDPAPAPEPPAGSE